MGASQLLSSTSLTTDSNVQEVSSHPQLYLRRAVVERQASYRKENDNVREWRKLPIQEIHELWEAGDFNSVITQVISAYRAGSVFKFGVDKLEDSYRLTINQMVSPIYLTDSEKVKPKDRFLAAIVPDVTLAGTVDWRAENHVIIFYVLPREFSGFCQEAEQIFNEYFYNDLCFRMIPDIWFSDTSLVQFIRKEMKPHPEMKYWFEQPHLMAGVDGFALSPKFDR
jgi:hypothetical protein